MKEEGVPEIHLIPRKLGKTTVSFKYKYNGKTRTYKFNIKVVKYTKPFRKLMVGSKNYANHFKNCSLKYGTEQH